MRFLPLLGKLALLVLTLVVGYGVVVLLNDPTPGRSTPSSSAPGAPAPIPTPSAEPTPAAVRALLFGSDLAAPDGGPGFGEIAAQQLGWRARVVPTESSGFQSEGEDGKKYGQLLPALLAAQPADVVVVSAGRADGEVEDEQQYAAEVAFLLNEVRVALPQARVVLIGPVGPDGFPRQRNSLQAVGARLGAFVVDPIDRNFLGDQPGSTNEDGSLTESGHQLVGRRLAAELRKVLPAPLLATATPVKTDLRGSASPTPST